VCGGTNPLLAPNILRAHETIGNLLSANEGRDENILLVQPLYQRLYL
jgi:hypothetical protein